MHANEISRSTRRSFSSARRQAKCKSKGCEETERKSEKRERKRVTVTTILKPLYGGVIEKYTHLKARVARVKNIELEKNT